MINKITLKNWRSHANTDLEFSQGTNVLVGAMGSGKSSVLNAICFSLFGTFPELQTKKIRQEDIIMKKPNQQNEAEISMQFEANGDIWAVTRKIFANKGSMAELRKGGHLVEVQPKKVTETIEGIIKMDYDLFIRTVYSEQNAIDMFLTLPKGRRMEKIDDMLRLNRFESARSTAITLSNKIKGMIEIKMAAVNEIEKDKEILQIDTIKKEISALEGRMLYLKESIQKIDEELKEKQKTLEWQKSIEKELMVLNTRRTTLEKQLKDENEELNILIKKIGSISIKEIEKDITTLEAKIKEMEKKSQDIEKSLNETKRAYDKAEFVIKKSKEEIEEVKKQIDERHVLLDFLRKNDPDQLEAAYEIKKDKILDIKKRIGISEGRIEQIKETMKILRDNVICPVCESDISSGKREEIEMHKKQEIERIEVEKNELMKKLELYTKELKELDKLVILAKFKKQRAESLVEADEKYEKLMNLMEENTKQLQLLSETIRSMEAQQKDIKEVLEEERTICMQKKEILYAANQKLALEQKIAEHTKEMCNIEERIKSISLVFDANLAKALEHEITRLIAQKSSLEKEQGMTEMLIKEKNMRLSLIEAKRHELEQLKKEITIFEKMNADVLVLIEALKFTQSALREEFVKNINAVISALWPSLYPYKDFFSARLNVSEGDYVLELEDITGWVPVDGIASGGERAISCLVLRIAFAYVLAPHINWLILDEPTHNLDARAIQELCTVLRERISQFIKQVFIITHEPALENAVTGHLFRFERNKASNEPTRIVCLTRGA